MQLAEFGILRLGTCGHDDVDGAFGAANETHFLLAQDRSKSSLHRVANHGAVVDLLADDEPDPSGARSYGNGHEGAGRTDALAFNAREVAGRA